jgi:hypothetical protein
MAFLFNFIGVTRSCPPHLRHLSVTLTAFLSMDVDEYPSVAVLFAKHGAVDGVARCAKRSL